MRDAEVTDRGASTVAEGEGEDEPRTDSEDQEEAGDPADLGVSVAVSVRADLGGEAREDAESQSGEAEEAGEKQIVVAGRDRVDVIEGDEGDGRQRPQQRPQVELPLTSLAEHDED